MRSESLQESSLNSNERTMRDDHSWMLPSHSSKACKFFNFLIAEPATTKCKLVTVLQLLLSLMTGQTRTNSHQNLNQFEVNESW